MQRRVLPDRGVQVPGAGAALSRRRRAGGRHGVGRLFDGRHARQDERPRRPREAAGALPRAPNYDQSVAVRPPASKTNVRSIRPRNIHVAPRGGAATRPPKIARHLLRAATRPETRRSRRGPFRLLLAALDRGRRPLYGRGNAGADARRVVAGTCRSTASRGSSRPRPSTSRPSASPPCCETWRDPFSLPLALKT